MTPVELSRTVLCAVRCAVDAGELRVAVPSRAVVAPPRPGGRGDYATNIALQLARPAGQPPLRVAEILRSRISGAPGIADVEITGPGFLNIHLEPATAGAALVREILHRRPPTTPTGGDAPLTLRIPRDPRARVIADALVRILATQGSRADVRYARPGEPCEVRPVPAVEDPTPLGPDAARWALLYPAAHDRPRIGGEHLVQRESNPLFRVRYAHSRARALVRNAGRLGFDSEPGDVADVPEAGPVLRTLAEYPNALTQAAAHRAPDRLARHLVAVADALLAFQHTVLPLGDEKPSAAHRARLALAEAAGTVLAGGLSLLGISAPDYL
ncbi:ArgS-related anticodon-binding protein NrtL [Streptomyces sp. NPDC052051]|uniref:ArgS-related anticodon-binding protein NrtL n=1 Tax=Streptomyces sp. NPDC052051 TaxID=3154649 RepID=UPI00341FCA86